MEQRLMIIDFGEWCRQYGIYPLDATKEQRQAYLEDMIEVQEKLGIQ